MSKTVPLAVQTWPVISPNAVHVPSEVLRVGPHGFAVYAALLAKANARAMVKRSQRDIGADCGVSPSTAKAALNALRDAGWITWRQDGTTTCIYKLHPTPLPREQRQRPSDRSWHVVLPDIATKRRSISPQKRQRVYERDAYRCVTCGGYERLTLDHIIPVSRGGGNEESNLQTMCLACNMKKGARL